jgi:hypothetical protein
VYTRIVLAKHSGPGSGPRLNLKTLVPNKRISEKTMTHQHTEEMLLLTKVLFRSEPKRSYQMMQ